LIFLDVSGYVDGIAGDSIRSGNDFLIDELGTFSASKADFDTATVLFCMSFLHSKTIAIHSFKSDTRHETLDTERRLVDFTSTNICFVDADCEAYVSFRSL